MSKSSPKHFFSKLASVSMPRSKFDMSYKDTSTFTTDYLYPNYCMLVIPGDTVSLGYSNVSRMISSITTPMMDNLRGTLDFWFVPFRLNWQHTNNFFGEEDRNGTGTDFTIPTIKFDSTKTVPTSGSGPNNVYLPEQDAFAGLPQARSIYDYFSIPIQGTDNVLSGDFVINALPLRAYNLIFDEWYRDEQRVDYSYYNNGDNQDTADKYYLLKRGKQFDYFTSSLLEPQTGSPVSIPLGVSAPVNISGNGKSIILSDGVRAYGVGNYYSSGAGAQFAPAVSVNDGSLSVGSAITNIGGSSGAPFQGTIGFTKTGTGLTGTADLSSASAATIATLRQAFQLQAYQEINARNGNRLTEYIYGQYGVISPDARLQRPEFLGRTTWTFNVQPVEQTSSTDSVSPQGNLSGIVYGGCADHIFTRSFTEHGFIIGILNIRSDLTYYQGLDRIWSLSTPLDIPLPVFGNLTDEAILRKEILLTGNDSSDNAVFGYGERYAWCKYQKNTVRGLVRPNAPLSIGQWCLAQQLDATLSNNGQFITNDTPIGRIVAVIDQPNFIVNQKFNVDLIRELPAYANPERWMFRS